MTIKLTPDDMNIVLLQGKIEQDEINKLIIEFSDYLFLSFSEASYKNLRAEDWKRVEILYGNRLTAEELQGAPQLRWIHTPSTSQKLLCMDTITTKGNVLVTGTVERNDRQVAEFVMSGILAYSKNLFHWKESAAFPSSIWDSKWRDSMWQLEHKTMLIVGLDDTASEIAKFAKYFGIKVYGLKGRKAFHPNFDKVFSYNDLPSLLPTVDIVCLNSQDSSKHPVHLGKIELDLMKKDSILVCLRSNSALDPEALLWESQRGKFRGVLLDASYQIPVPVSSPLWKIPNSILTPDVAPRPKSVERLAYKIFRYNLRQYRHSNFTDMKNVVYSGSVASIDSRL